MKTNCSLLVAFAIGVSMISVRATPITSLFNTGVDSSGAVLPDGTVSDPHYRIVYSPSGSANIRVRSSAGGWAPSPFTGDDDSSRWIGPNTRSFWEGEEGLWIYRTTFYLTDGPPSAASIVGRIGVNPELEDIQLNGHSLDISVEFGNQAFESWQPFTINRHFVSGENTLDFLVENGGGPTSFRVEMIGTVDVPDTVSTAALILVGTVGLGVLRRSWRV